MSSDAYLKLRPAKNGFDPKFSNSSDDCDERLVKRNQNKNKKNNNNNSSNY